MLMSVVEGLGPILPPYNRSVVLGKELFALLALDFRVVVKE